MRSNGCIRLLILCALAAAVLLPTVGCGAKKKGKKGKTVAEQREGARAETTPDRRAAAFLKLARQQAAAGDRTGAKASALDAYREFYPEPAKQPAVKEQAAEQPAEQEAEAKPEGAAEEKPADTGEAEPAEEKAAEAKGPDGKTAAAEEKAPAEGEEKPPADEEPAPPVEERPAIDANLAAPRLVEIAEVFAMLGDRKQARKALGKAIDEELIGAIEDPVRKTRVLAEAGAIYGAKTDGVGDAGRAKAILAKAAEAAENVDERFRAEALAAVALGYTRSNLANLAEKTVEGLMKAAENLEEPRAKAEALAAAANVKAQTGNKDDASSLLEEAAAAAKSVTRPESKAYALLAVAVATNANGDAKAALALLKEADKAANKVAEPDAMKTIVDKVRALTLELEKKKKK